MPERVPRLIAGSDPSLNSVGAGLALAQQVIAAVRSGEAVTLDLRAAERMTPSFANALVMTILESIAAGQFESMVQPLFASQTVEEAWSKAAERYRRGIRLSTQRPDVA
jgi:hypothetical protein